MRASWSFFEPLSEEQVKAVRATLAGLRLLSGR